MRRLIILAAALALLGGDALARARGDPGDHGDRGDKGSPPAPEPPAAAPAPQSNADGPDTRGALRPDDACRWPFWQRTLACRP